MDTLLLKPCPFCGGPATAEFDAECNGYFVWCENEHMDCAAAPLVGPASRTDGAVAAWNVRLPGSSNGTVYVVAEDGALAKQEG